jgi:hypothetical protein
MTLKLQQGFEDLVHLKFKKCSICSLATKKSKENPLVEDKEIAL